jgi:hypothetical protein
VPRLAPVRLDQHAGCREALDLARGEVRSIARPDGIAG